MGRKRSRHTARASERLRRLLVVVPYVVRHPGTTVQEISRLFAVAESELLEDLNLLFMSGLPPYGPGDLIDVQVEDGRVWIGMADYFSRPVRLSRSEALALYLKGKALLGAPGLEEAPALASALDKIEQGLGRDTLTNLSGRVAVGESAGGGDRLAARALADVRSAADRRERVEIEYYSASRDEMTTRRIDPEQVFAAIGNWYVVAWDHLAADERLFRVDRIHSVKPVGETFEPRGLLGAGRPLYSRSERDIPIRLLVGPSARWVAEYYEVERATQGEDGMLDVTMPAKQLAWVAKLVLRLGGEARVIAPPELAELVRRAASDTLALYRRGGR